MLPALNQARFGSYLILPFQFEEGGLHADWIDRTLTPGDVTTVDLNEIARSMMSRDSRMSIGSCRKIPRDVLLREMTDGALHTENCTLYVETEAGRRRFSLTDSWLYVFHSHVAFLALGTFFDQIETITIPTAYNIQWTSRPIRKPTSPPMQALDAFFEFTIR